MADQIRVKRTVKEESMGPRDSFEYAVTHQIEGREKLWVKFGMSTSLKPGESYTDVTQRLIRTVHEGIDQAVEAAIDHAGEMSSRFTY